MESFLHFLRTAANILLIFLFMNLLLLAIPISSLTSNLSREDKIKSWLAESNFYENLYDNGINIVEIENQGEVKPIAEHIDDSGVFSADEVSAMLKRAIPPEYLQQQVEGVVGSTYAFLDGRTENLAFSFSLSERADEFAKEAREFFGERLSDLPVCTQNQIRQMRNNNEDFNPLTADCRPPGNVQQAIDKLVDELAGEDGPLNSTLTAEDTEIDPETRQNLRNLYLASRNMAPAMLLTLLLLLGLIAATSRPWHKGLKVAGLGTAVVGLVMLGIFIFANSLKDDIGLKDDAGDFSSSQREGVDALLSPLIKQAGGDIIASGILFSSLAIAAGSAMVLTDHQLTKRHRGSKTKTMLDDDYEDDDPDKKGEDSNGDGATKAEKDSDENEKQAGQDKDDEGSSASKDGKEAKSEKTAKKSKSGSKK